MKLIQHTGRRSSGKRVDVGHSFVWFVKGSGSFILKNGIMIR